VRSLGWGNSSDTAGDPDRVVGYGAFAVTEPEPSAQPGVDERATAAAPPSLLGLARGAIEDGLAGRETPPPDLAALPTELAAARGCFVTLHRRGALRGCVGTVEAERPLAHDVTRNARRAAFADPRFAPLTADEWPEVAVSVSVLGPLEPLAASSVPELVGELRPGDDGVVVAGSEGGRATFLPAVWEQLPDPVDFVDRLWHKAGLVPGTWPPGLRTWRYRVDEIDEAAPEGDDESDAAGPEGA
jgi:AmmeMemoRadiSam system protein A